jgi:two-component system NarL family sensor kinase
MDFLHRFLKTAHPTKAEKRILVALLSILIILCTLTYLSHRNSKRVISTSEAVEQSQETKYHIAEVLSLCTDLETDARGFIITFDTGYLNPSAKATDEVFKHLAFIKSAAAGDAVKMKRYEALDSLVKQKVFITNRSIQVRRNDGLARAITFVSAGESKKLMDDIRLITNEMLADENALLEKEMSDNRRHIKNFNLTFDLLLLKIAISILTVFFILRFYFNARRKSEHLLNENKQLLQSIIDNTTSVIFIKDLNGKYLLINSRFENLFHISAEKVKDKSDYDIFPAEIAESVVAADREVIENKKLMEFEEDVPNNGEMRHYLSIKFPLFDEDNNVYALCGIATDITERKLMEKQIRDHAENILDLFNNAPCGYHSTNVDGTIVEMNDTELKWLGFERSETIGKINIRTLINSESHHILEENFSKMKEGTLSFLQNIELMMQRKDGTVFPVEAHITVQFDEDGKFLRTRTTLFDITVRKQAEMLMLQN